AHDREHVRDAERDYRVSVVAAGMHSSGHLGWKRYAALLGHRQSINVGAHTDPAPRGCTVQQADDSSTADPGTHFDAGPPEIPGNGARRFVFLERELGVLME